MFVFSYCAVERTYRKAASEMVLLFVMLSDKLVKEFRDVFREEYGCEMSDIEAARAASWLVSYFDVLAGADAEVKELQVPE